MPRFVILEHDHPVLHWDLMLEAGDVLRTWRLDTPPAPGRAVCAVPIGDHRKAYLDYEGPVSGQRGRVKRWDWGVYQPAAQAAGSSGEVNVIVTGQRLLGRLTLRAGPEQKWAVQFEDRGGDQLA
jgi:hypothetical protein